MGNLVFTDLTTVSYAKLINGVISKSKPNIAVIIGYDKFRAFINSSNETEVVFIDMQIIDSPTNIIDIDLSFDLNLYKKFLSLPYLLRQSFIRLGSKYSDFELIDLVSVKYFKFFQDIITRYSIRNYISFSVPHFPGEISLFSLVELNGCNNIFFWGSGLNNIVFASNNIVKIYDTNIKFRKSNLLAIERELGELINKSKEPIRLTPVYMNNIILKTLMLRAKYFVNRISLLFRRNESAITLLLAILNKRNTLLGHRHLKLYKKNCSEVIPDRDFVYLPLHMQPEATSVPFGGIMSNYAILINYLLNSIPDNLTILVKENPKQTYRQRNMELHKLLKHKRIIFVCNDVNTYDLINESIAVVSTTGTVLLESALLKKRAIVLGSSIYSLLPNIIEIEELKNYDKWEEPDYSLEKISFTKFTEFLEYSSIVSPVISNPYLDYESNIIDATAHSIYELLLERDVL